MRGAHEAWNISNVFLSWSCSCSHYIRPLCPDFLRLNFFLCFYFFLMMSWNLASQCKWWEFCSLGWHRINWIFFSPDLNLGFSSSASSLFYLSETHFFFHLSDTYEDIRQVKGIKSGHMIVPRILGQCSTFFVLDHLISVQIFFTFFQTSSPLGLFTSKCASMLMALNMVPRVNYL